MQMLSLNQLVGQELGNYRIERFLGQGRLSLIYLARHLTAQRLDALTFYPLSDRFSSEARTRFLLRFRKEATAITSLAHPHILPIYEHGDRAGHPYLVTPYMAHGSLVDMLQRHGQYDHHTVLPILEQVVSGLAHAHSQGFIHGTLRPATIVVSEEHTLRVAGFGLMHMLQQGGVESTDQKKNPYMHLLSIADTFLVAPEYVAPEVIRGQSIDARSDIYALGCILFELLSGQPPFSGKDAVALMQKHITEVIPSLHRQNPEVPIALASVVNQALERDPARRFQHVLELHEAFRQASHGAARSAMSDSKRQTKVLKNRLALQQTDPDTANKWQLVPPIVTGKQPTVQISESIPIAHMPAQSINTDHWCALPPHSTGQYPTVISGKMPSLLDSASKIDPFSLNRKTTAIPEMPTQTINTDAWHAISPHTPDQSLMATSGRMPAISIPTPQAAKPPVQPEISEMPTQAIHTDACRAIQAKYFESDITGFIPALSAEHTKQSMASEQASHQVPFVPQEKANADLSSLVKAYAWWSQPGVVSTADQLLRSEKTHGQSEVPREVLRLDEADAVKWGNDPALASPFASRPVPVPRQIKRRKAVALLATGGLVVAAAAFNLNKLQHLFGNTFHQTTTTITTHAQMHMKETAPLSAHTEPVLGQTTMALNSAETFINAADGQSSLLLHLPNNTFVAYEKACTHEQVPVVYDSATKLLVCPAHGSMFDPANGGAVVQGPAVQPLPSVKVRINADGTITAM